MSNCDFVYLVDQNFGLLEIWKKNRYKFLIYLFALLSSALLLLIRGGKPLLIVSKSFLIFATHDLTTQRVNDEVKDTLEINNKLSILKNYLKNPFIQFKLFNFIIFRIIRLILTQV